MPLSREQIHTLIEWLGEDGAKGGLDRSHYTVKDLRTLASELNADVPAKAARKDVVSAIVSKVDQRIDKPVQELLTMSVSDLLEYFERVRPNKAELLTILGDLDFHPGSEAQKSLYKYAARQISETGMFQRVASRS
ncbi:hypothetical protein FJ492_22610 [Mesorhizobium sp. B2-5-4]|uniref:hypothetical protein n=1 Tax=Mesorhizobium sp. B2-5-4 TaxID=2589926 RepID=UPI001127C678|nr:hypothetical protein [Mesorhizobium sp. B2-5-4]TPK39222.1 hypothetical protein FJ492_22610 [Mesorhizobium sp. B2-5-4]